MSGSTNFLQINPNATNQESDAAYASDTQRSGGMVSGVFASILANKIFYQMSIFVAALAQALANKGFSPNDGSSNPSTALATLTGVLSNIITSADNPIRAFRQNNVVVNPANTLLNTIYNTLVIPAGSMGLNSQLRVTLDIDIGSIAVNGNVVVSLNTGGASSIANYFLPAGSSALARIVAIAGNAGSLTVQNSDAQLIVTTAAGVISGQQYSVAGGNANTANAITVVVQYQAHNSGDTVSFQRLIVELIP